MKYFCFKCGKTTQYGLELPRFCAYCGQSFAKNSSSPKTGEQQNKFLNELKLKKNTNDIDITKDILYNADPPKDLDAEEYTENRSTNFKNIRPSFKLDLYQNKGESFGSLIDNPSQSLPQNINSETAEKSSQDILNDFQKEAGALRPK